MNELTGKVAIVTGGSKGMGRHFVAALVQQGVKVACLARPSHELDTLGDGFGESVLPLACDVTDPGAVNRAIDAVAKAYGQIDVLAHNAAFYQPFAFETASDKIMRDHVEVNVMGSMWLFRAAIPHLRKTHGQIVAISSETVALPMPMLGLYAATKAAMEVLCEGLRHELREDGIRISVLRSGNVAGGTSSSAWPKDVAESFFRKIVSSGHAALSGASASPESMARALIAILTLPRDVSTDLAVIRAANPGIPQTAREHGGPAK